MLRYGTVTVTHGVYLVLIALVILWIPGLVAPFLLALALVVLPIEYLHLADPAIFYIAIGSMILTVPVLKPPERFALGLLFATYPTASLNGSAVSSPVLLLLALERALASVRAIGALRSAVGIGLLLAALLSVKSTLIPGGVLFVFLWGSILAAMTRDVRPLAWGLISGLLALDAPPMDGLVVPMRWVSMLPVSR